MLTKYDELFCHQTPTTFDHVADSGDGWRENMWACAYDVSGKIFLGAFFGVSTNRNVMDSCAQLTMDSKTQYNIRASRQLQPNNSEITVGPMSYEVIDGLRAVRWSLAENEYGISWDVRFDASMPAREEVPQFARSRGRLRENMCRWGQTGRAEGWVKVEGKTYEINPDTWVAHRDRSWGIRWHANIDAAAMGLQPPEPFLGLTFDWNILQFDDWCVLSQRREDYDGNVTYFSGGITYAFDKNRSATTLVDEKVEFELVPGTKQLKAGRIIYQTEDGAEIVITFKVISVIFIHAGGYWPYKGYRLGTWMGPNWIDGEKVDATDPEEIKKMEEGPTYMVECQCSDKKGTGMIQFGIHGNHHIYAPLQADQL